MSCYGGPIETPNIDKLAADGVRYTQWHTTALCSPTRSCLLTGRNHTRNSMACITEAAIGFPNASGTIPPENGMLSEILGELGWNTYMVGKWHLCPEDEMNLASTRRNWPSGPGLRALVRVPRRRDEPVVSRTSSTTTTSSTSRRRRRRGTTSPSTSPTRRSSSSWTRRRSRRRSRSSSTTRPARATRRTTRRRSGSRSTRAASTWATRRCARRRSPGRRSSGSSRRTPSCRRSTRSARPRRAPGPTASRSRRSTSPGRGTRSRTTRRRCSAAWPRSTPGSSAHADDQIGRLLGFLEEYGWRENTLVILVSDNGASGEGGPNGSVNEMKFMQGIPDTVEANMPLLDELGSPKTYNHYPNGWAMAFNTPFKMWKRYEFNGGTSDPCIVSWPAGLKAKGEVRDQYHHAIDLVPTVLDVLGVEAPEAIKGHVQSSLRRRQHALELRRREGAVDADDAVLLDARLAGDLARRLEGGHEPPDGRRLEQLQRRRVGAVPHRRRPLRAAQPRGRAAGEGARAREPLVRGGRRERRVPARRPRGRSRSC